MTTLSHPLPELGDQVRPRLGLDDVGDTIEIRDRPDLGRVRPHDES